MEPPASNDPRVPLAAERTLLAWVRTGLALMGFGFVVARFGLFLHEVAAVRGGPAPEDHGSVWLGAFMVALGSAVNVLAAIRHVRLIRRLERGGTYRMDIWSLGVGVTLLLAALGAVMTAYLIIERPS
jgi:putative membrane protein